MLLFFTIVLNFNEINAVSVNRRVFFACIVFYYLFYFKYIVNLSYSNRCKSECE